MNITGGAWVALITPMKQDYQIDYPALKKLLHMHIAAKVSGLVLLGTTGEAPTLQLQERLALLRFCCDEVQSKIPIIAGIGCNNTPDLEIMLDAYNALPIDGYMISTPHYNRPNAEGLVAFYQHACQRTSRPVIAYNVPSRTGCDLPIAVLEALYPIKNFVGLKEASGCLHRIWQYRQRFPKLLLWSGDDGTFLPMMRLGGDGVISVAANLLPHTIQKICDLAQSDQWCKAARLDASLQQLYTQLASDTNPIPIKAAMACEGMIDNVLRLPLTPLNEAKTSMLNATLDKLEQTVRWPAYTTKGDVI